MLTVREFVDKLIQEMNQLFESEQQAFMEEDRRWQEFFNNSWHVLEQLGAEALAEHEAGLTQDIPDDCIAEC